MNILFVVPYTPNLIRVRPYNIIRELTRQGHDVCVATLWTDDGERKDAFNLEKQIAHVESAYLPGWRSIWNCLTALPTNKPLQAVYSWQPSLAGSIDDYIARRSQNGGLDVVHVEHMRGAHYGLGVKQRFPEIPVIWDSVDCISLLFEKASSQSSRIINRWISSFELKRNRKYESWLLEQFDGTLVTSDVDRDALLNLRKSKIGEPPEISVLPNGVDLDYFKPDEEVEREYETLVVSGKMSYHANVTMVSNLVGQIMPLVWASRPNVKLWIVGKDPVPKIKAMAQDYRITVTGTVDDIRPYLRKATIAVSPVIYGVGIQNKVLEAMACGTPVVSTPQAISTLKTIPDRDVLVADEPNIFASYILSLMADASRREEIGNFGLQYVKAHHQWSSIAGQLVGIYNEAIVKRRQSNDT